jgi:hypothetical protein
MDGMAERSNEIIEGLSSADANRAVRQELAEAMRQLIFLTCNSINPDGTYSNPQDVVRRLRLANCHLQSAQHIAGACPAWRE